MGTHWSFCEAAFPFGVIGSSHKAQGLLSQGQLQVSMKMNWQAAGGRAGPGLVTFSCLDSFLVNLRKLTCYPHLIIAHHKTSDVFVGKPLHFPPILGQFVFGSSWLSVFTVQVLSSDGVYWCGSVVNTLDCVCFMAFIIYCFYIHAALFRSMFIYPITFIVFTLKYY